ncbi:phytanoyl-CoA dioxygenase family protein [Pseudomonas sp. 5P_3.1_Bac2]|uniref:phytanoyl-CoA dioxygenase family protein n=1 Tax=Pseudomonas sp. 5P_3.1_Bac2 TaxID=2971617 RepID=UPI0021C56AA1|nr:phytanoyl-CoA dioxygenase family protein [Pseudomonas sp. 5P_3.1_Bac2]MCU1717280.1 phytanoyl-CoA dioxygenase family protein [Pseudomonas sp. 5P_3.1_Bac2]
MDAQWREAFNRDGVVVVRGLFADWIEPLRAAVADNLAHPGPLQRNYTPNTAAGRFIGDYCNWPNIAGYREFIQHSPAAQLAKQLMGSRQVRIFHEHMLVKEAGNPSATPWHHDEPYYCASAEQTVSIWLPLDPVARSSSVEFVAGSHLWGKQFRPRKFTGADYEQDVAGLEAMPDIEGNRQQYQILGWDLALGDAIAFDFRTVHGAPGNRSLTDARRVLSTRWLGDNACYVDRHGETSPPYTHLIGQLSHGQTLPESEFPYIATPA